MLEVVGKDGHVEGKDLVEEENVKVVVRKMVIVMCHCGGGDVVDGRQSGDVGSATMLNSQALRWVFQDG